MTIGSSTLAWIWCRWMGGRPVKVRAAEMRSFVSDLNALRSDLARLRSWCVEFRDETRDALAALKAMRERDAADLAVWEKDCDQYIHNCYDVVMDHDKSIASLSEALSEKQTIKRRLGRKPRNAAQK